MLCFFHQSQIVFFLFLCLCCCLVLLISCFFSSPLNNVLSPQTKAALFLTAIISTCSWTLAQWSTKMLFFVSPKQSLSVCRSCRCHLFNIFFFAWSLTCVWAARESWGPYSPRGSLDTAIDVLGMLPNTDLQSECAMCDSLYTAVEMARDLKDCKK